MPSVPVHNRKRSRSRHIAGVLIAVGVVGFSAAPASATICPGGNTGDPLNDYCVASADFETVLKGDGPEAWYRMNDGIGAETMADSSPLGPSTPPPHDGQYKNAQDGGPVGISADGDHARDFWGESGYGFVNGIPAPGPDNHYTSYTLEAWFYLADTDFTNVNLHNDSTIVQFGGGPAIYIKSNTIRFRNGPDDEIVAPTLFQDEKWYMVVARKSGNHMALWLKQSPAVPTYFNPTPDITGISTYRPGGSPTFYVGYGTWAPWFNGAIDEVSYFTYALTTDQLAYHFYADPAPDGRIGKPLEQPAASDPVATPTFADNSSTPVSKPTKKPALSRKAQLAKARTLVKHLNSQIARTKKWIGSLKHHHSSAKSIKAARAQLAKLQKQLKHAKAKVKQLS